MLRIPFRGSTPGGVVPGIDRFCFGRAYEPYVGEMMDIRLRLPVEGRRALKGFCSWRIEMIVVSSMTRIHVTLTIVDRAQGHAQLDMGR